MGLFNTLNTSGEWFNPSLKCHVMLTHVEVRVYLMALWDTKICVQMFNAHKILTVPLKMGSFMVDIHRQQNIS